MRRPAIRSVLKWGAVGLGVAGAAAFAARWLLQQRREASEPIPGQRVDVGGHAMHLVCRGTGSPTVVLESGAGGTWSEWDKVVPTVSQHLRVCAYDRAGLGWSDPTSDAVDGDASAQRLHGLLQAAHLPGPYVLVGQSLGGLYVRVFQHHFPSEVSGLVLVDATSPGMETRLPKEMVARLAGFHRTVAATAWASRFGLDRALGLCWDPPAADATWHDLTRCRPQAWDALAREVEAIPVIEHEAEPLTSLGDLPLVVLTRDPDYRMPGMPEPLSSQSNAVWAAMQDELAKLSTRSTHVVVPHAGHMIHQDAPETIIRAIWTAAGLPVRTVIVPAEDLAAGVVLSADQLAQRELPDVDGGWISADRVESIEGMHAKVLLRAGEPLRADDLAR